MKLCNIWGNNPLENIFRRKLDLREKPQRAVARIFVDTGYELFINGRLVAHVDEWANTRDYDVRLFLQHGENLIAVRGINHAGHRGFTFELVADNQSVLVSDDSWRVLSEERWGWMLPDFDDSMWDFAKVMDMSCAGAPQWNTMPGNDPTKIIPVLDGTPFFQAEIPKRVDSPFFTAKLPDWRPTDEVLEIAGRNYREFASRPLPQIITADKLLHCNNCQTGGGKVELSAQGRYSGAGFVLDFEEEVVGFLRMRVKSEKEVGFRIFYGETINEAMGEISRDVCQHRMLVEEYRLRGGVQEFESRMRVGFRFARMEFFDCSASLIADGFSLRTSLYPVAFKGYFHCNDELLNRIWRAGYKTLHLCMQEYYIDAVKRDRFLWVGDARNEVLYNYYLFGDTALFEFCWDEMAKCQYPDGSIPSAYGQGLSLIWDYVAWYVIAFHDYYLHTGKKEFLLKHKITIEKAVDWLISKAGDDGLIDIPANPLGVWMVVLNKAVGQDTLMNWLYMRSLEMAVELENIAGDSIRQNRYQDIRDKVASKVQALLQTAPIADCKANWSNATAMTEIVGQKFQNGHVDAAFKLIRDRWGAMLAGGADTLFEGFYHEKYPSVTGVNPAEKVDFISYCHGWTGGATMLLMSEVAGIKPLVPGFERFSITPKPGDLTEFTAVVPTPYGEIAVRLADNDFTVVVPDGTTALFEYEGIEIEWTSGTHKAKICNQ